jgi:ketosteroid isomerase-like protein
MASPARARRGRAVVTEGRNVTHSQRIQPVRTAGRLVQTLFVCVLVAGATHTASAQAVKSDQQMLEDLERQWDTAFRNGNVKFIDSILDRDFIATYDDGMRADRAKELELAGSQSQQIDDSDLDDFTVKINGNTAVVWFTLHLLGPIKGKPVQIDYHYIDVWVLRDGQWKCIATQSTRIAAPREAPAN